jgi:hypothetical protein
VVEHHHQPLQGVQIHPVIKESELWLLLTFFVWSACNESIQRSCPFICMVYLWTNECWWQIIVWGGGFTTTLTREPRRLKPSDSAPILQYDSTPSPGLLAKILDISTQLFLCNMQFYFWIY